MPRFCVQAFVQTSPLRSLRAPVCQPQVSRRVQILFIHGTLKHWNQVSLEPQSRSLNWSRCVSASTLLRCEFLPFNDATMTTRSARPLFECLQVDNAQSVWVCDISVNWKALKPVSLLLMCFIIFGHCFCFGDVTVTSIYCWWVVSRMRIAAECGHR